METQSLIGKTLFEAETLAVKSGYKIRVTKRDDYYFLCTMDYRMDRINLKIENEIVVSATIG